MQALGLATRPATGPAWATEQHPDKPRPQPPDGTVAVGDDEDREQRGAGDRTPGGELGELDEAQNDGEGDHDRTFDETTDEQGVFGLGGLHCFFLSDIKDTAQDTPVR